MPKPLVPSARRTDSDPLYNQADAIVVRWIAREDPPPAILARKASRRGAYKSSTSAATISRMVCSGQPTALKFAI